MAEHTLPIARIALARSTRALLGLPAILILLAAGAIAVSALIGGSAGLALLVAGAALAVLSLWMAARLLTLRLDVEVTALRLSWVGGERRYPLARGAVTRIAIRGERAVPLRPRFGAFGWALGSATLRRSERIQVVCLAPARTLIMVPIQAGRIAIAPRSEQELLAALTAAARVQHRLDSVASRTPELPAPAPPRPQPEQPPPEPLADVQPSPRFLTGIERVELEERLAAQRAVAIAAAEAERRAAAEALAAAPTVAAPALPERRPRLRGRPRVRAQWHRPAWLRTGEMSWGLVGVLLLPLLVAAAMWLIVPARGQISAQAYRSLALALLLGGPLGSLAAVGARRWWPSLVPLVVTTALLSLLVVGRALIA